MAATLNPLSEFIGVEIRGVSAADLGSESEAERCLTASDRFPVH